MDLQQVLGHPVVRGAITGLISAVMVDYGAFRKWQSFDEAKTYDWRVAAWRWVQGLVAGAVSAAGLDAVV